MGQQQTNEKNTINILGITLDSRLAWTYHINNLKNSIIHA